MRVNLPNVFSKLVAKLSTTVSGNSSSSVPSNRISTSIVPTAHIAQQQQHRQPDFTLGCTTLVMKTVEPVRMTPWLASAERGNSSSSLPPTLVPLPVVTTRVLPILV